MSLSRRGFLAGSTAALLLGGRTSRAASATTRPRPRKFIHLFLRGGFDAVLTTDPKTRADVGRGVDVPYEPSEILELERHRVGPLFADLKAYVPGMSILNGVHNGTVGHGTGLRRILQMRTDVITRDGLAVSLGGAISEGLSMPSVLSELWMFSAGPSMPDLLPARSGMVWSGWRPNRVPMLERLWTAANESAAYPAVARALVDEIAACHKAGTDASCASLEQTRAVFEWIRGKPKPPVPLAVEMPDDDPTIREWVKIAGYEWGVMTRDLVYALRYGLTSTAFVKTPHPVWDSHHENLRHQRRCARIFALGFDHLMTELRGAVSDQGVSLADETGLMIGSELGRFPMLNGASGKDHFPQHPFILVGPGLSPGQYGSTDQRMVARMISETTGSPGPRGYVPTIDDVGASVLQWFGIRPQHVGYRGRVLPFLLAS